MKAVVVADLHLHLWREASSDNGADRLADGLSALRQTLEYAQDRGVPWVFPGDIKHLTDRWPLAALNGALEVQDEYCRVPKLLIPGNHDGLAGGGSGLRPFFDRDESMIVLERPGVYEPFGLGKIAVWPWARSYEALPKLLADAKAAGAHVLLGHSFLSGAAVGPDGMALKAGPTLGDFGLTDKGRVFDWGLFGDVHVRQWSVGGTWQVNSAWDESKGREWRKGRAFTVFPGFPFDQRGEDDDLVEFFRADTDFGYDFIEAVGHFLDHFAGGDVFPQSIGVRKETTLEFGCLTNKLVRVKAMFGFGFDQSIDNQIGDLFAT